MAKKYICNFYQHDCECCPYGVNKKDEEGKTVLGCSYSDLHVNKFISRRFKTDCEWLTGNCYFFAVILKERFGGDIYYDDIFGHFAAMIDGELYDWRGQHTKTPEEHWVKWDEYDKYDSLLKQRIIRDCVL